VIGEQVIGTISGSTLRIPLETTTTYTSAVRFFPKMTFKFGEAAIDGKPLLLVRKASGQYACLVQGACFAAATPVRTSTGFRPIESIQAGDSVLSYNEADGAFVYSRVLNTFVKTTQQLVRVVVGQDTLLTTPEHLFRTTNAEWYTAGALFPGMSLVMAGGPGTVVSIQWIDSTLTVYNFEVAETHTYTVGLSQTVVHNSCEWFAALTNISADAIDKLKKLNVTRPALIAELKKVWSTDGTAVEKFLADFNDSPALLARFENGTLDINAWEALADLSRTIRKAPVNIEAAGKLRNLASTLTTVKKDKLLSNISRIITHADAGDAIGTDFLRILNSGILDDVENYILLIGSAGSDLHVMKSVQQAMNKAEEFINTGTNKQLLRFEDNPAGYDVDLGIKKTPTSADYTEVYQFKSNTAPLGTSQLQAASSQLFSAPSSRRIAELRLVKSDNLNDIIANAELTNQFSYYLFRKAASKFPTLIDEFILEFANGSKVRITYTNDIITYTNI
jgi:hypothetical protein